MGKQRTEIPFEDASGWRQSVLEEIQRVRDRATTARDAAISEESATAVAGHLEHAKNSATKKRLRLGRVVAWWTGADIERAWTSLHQAKQDSIMVLQAPELLAQIPMLRSKLGVHLKEGPERTTYEGWLKDAENPQSPPDRVRIRTVREAIDNESDFRYTRLRSFRNTLYVAAFAISVVVGVLVADPPPHTFLPVCDNAAASSSQPAATPSPSASPGTSAPNPSPTPTAAAVATASVKAPSCPAVWQLSLIGAFGGLLAAIAALSIIEVSDEPYGLRIAQAVLKVPAGAAFAIVGTMLLQSGIVGALTAQPTPKLFVYVVIFGFSQQTVTGFLDAKAKSLLPG